MGSLQDELTTRLAGRYRIDGELGRGGMAVVFLATDERHDRKVAIKVMSPGLATGTAAARFEREIRSVARLTHPHILPVLDSGELAGSEPRAWYAMPYVAGGSLRDRIDREGPLPVADAVRVVAEVAEALDYAHRQGMIHRDVKPGNVLLQDGQALLADFGIVSAVGADPEQRLTESGMVMGTARYTSPEQATGSPSVDHRTDVYSLGCVLHEALTGRAPFADAGSAAAILARVVTEDPEPVSRTRPAAATLDAIVSKALARLPADRFTTAGELAQALRASTPAQGLPAAPAAGRGVSTISGVRRPRRWKPAAAAALVLTAGAVVVWMGARSARPQGVAVGGVPSSRASLAVLPFDNLSPDPDNAYLAAGINAEIHTQLSKIGGIRLIGRPSIQRYEGADTDLSGMADELGLTHALGGSVQRVGDEVRISVQLYDVGANEQLWGEAYERELVDVFEVQRQVAIRVADALRGVLTSQERARLAEALTDEPRALEQYLLGNARWRRFFNEADVRAANDAFERAVALDPDFAPAWSKLVQTRLQLAWLWGEPQERARARAALERLETLAPESPEHRMARAIWLYWGVLDYQASLEELEVLGDLWPGDVNVLMFTGAIQRRLGRWDEAIEMLERAFELDPYNGSVASNLGQWLTALRRFDEAEPYARRAVSLQPDVAVEWWHLAYVHMLRGDWDRAQAVVDSAGALLVHEQVEGGGWWAGWQLLRGNLSEVLDLYRELYRSDPRTFDGTWGRWWDFGLAGAAATGDEETVRAFAQDLRAGAEAALPEVGEDDVRLRAAVLERLIVAEAYLDNRDRVLDLAREVAIDPVRRAEVDQLGGRRDEAVEGLRNVLSSQGEYTVHLMLVDPRWISLHDHPGFQALIAEEARPNP